MAVTALRSVSKNLPHADIYLNDLWEIEAVLSQAYSKLMSEATIDFEYEVDKYRITTKEELIAYGGYTTEFTLTLLEVKPYAWSTNLVSFGGFTNPQLNIPVRLKELDWEIQGRIYAIYQQRRKAYKNFVVALPGWAVFALGPVFMLLNSSFHRLAIFHAKQDADFLFALAIPLILFGAYTFGLFSKNRLYLQNSREDQRARTALIRERLEKLSWLILGLVLGVIGTLVTNHYKH